MAKQKAIEPSEILIGNDGTIHNKLISPNPWFRFLARMFDYSFFFFLLWALFLMGKFRSSSLVPFEYFLWIPFEATFLRLCGNTPGKWLMGIELRQGRLSRLGFLTALRRSFHVWFRGLGMGIPFINVICMLVAFQRLKIFRTTTWDRDDHIQVIYQHVSKWRIFLAVILTIASFGFYFSQKYTPST